jgi:hypothetical protein
MIGSGCHFRQTAAEGKAEKGLQQSEVTTMECKQARNLKNCTCSYDPCSRKGICCDCLAYHLRARQLPGCCFPADAERTYDRSFEHFARLVQQKKI